MTDEQKSPTGGEAQVDSTTNNIISTTTPATADKELASILDEMTAVLNGYVSLPEGAAAAITLWVVSAHTLESADFAPRLALLSPLPECGKTTAIDLLSHLVPDPVTASNASSASIYRMLKSKMFTFIFDEGDTFMDGKTELMGIINSGHSRSTAYVLRCGSAKQNFASERFPTFCPMIIARIGDLTHTLESRSIIIHMRRKKPDEPIKPIKSLDRDLFTVLCARVGAWAKANVAKLKDAEPKMPDGFSSRRADNWRHLFAIADLAGLEWGQRARKVAVSLEGESETPMGVRLLEATRQVIDGQNLSKISSATLADDPTLEAHTGIKWTPNTLAAVLRPFGIRPKSVRIGNQTPKGYERSQFTDAWERFLKPRTSQGDGQSA